MGLAAATVGGRPGLISCSSAATAMVLKEISTDENLGLAPMALCVLIVGGMQLLVAIFRLGRFIALVPHPVMLGFVNGLGILIAKAQIHQFREHGADSSFCEKKIIIGMLLTCIVSMVVAVIFPRIPRIGKLCPAPIIAIIVSAIFACFIDSAYPTRTLKDIAGEKTFKGGWDSLPVWNFPPKQLDWNDGNMWAKIIPTAVRMSLVGLVESLLTLLLVDQITETRGSTTRECFGQGIGNIMSGLFGTQGGCALIGQTLLNIGSGGRGRLSGFCMATSLAACVICLAPIVGKIPVASLVGLMFLVAINTFAWGTYRLFHMSLVQWTDGVTIILVTVVTVITDLATAVFLGLVFSSLVFTWNQSTEIKIDESTNGKTRIFTVKGILFFGSVLNFQKQIEVGRIEEKEVEVDLRKVKILDHSALDAIAKVTERLVSAGKTVEYEGLTIEAQRYLQSTLVWSQQ
eukprot:gnl/TRDRNA2_/TRDRNA2_74126_c0_seq1.p1 gnl/TRDRNA2_/TRDRNA2_74126_c0~~gnl/TRDRNA2_/TRDRNA2_74126_c0_seq1.p1  ORF type:complete len:496 (+),score=74.18 gnl/TRDRNA2_/TRDRNA2_74126_c0_seq1:111-1490(+)